MLFLNKGVTAAPTRGTALSTAARCAINLDRATDELTQFSVVCFFVMNASCPKAHNETPLPVVSVADTVASGSRRNPLWALTLAFIFAPAVKTLTLTMILPPDNRCCKRGPSVVQHCWWSNTYCVPDCKVLYFDEDWWSPNCTRSLSLLSLGAADGVTMLSGSTMCFSVMTGSPPRPSEAAQNSGLTLT